MNDEEDDFYDEDEGEVAVAAQAPAAATRAAPAMAPAASPNALPPQWWIRPPEAPQPDQGKISAITELFNRVPPEQAIKTIEMANQLEGMLGFEADVKAGVPTMDAIKKWAPKMYFKHPAAVAALNKPVPAPFSPTAVDVGGHKLIQTGPNRFQFPPSVPVNETGPLELRPLVSPEGKRLGYGAPGKGGTVHPKWDSADPTQMKPSDLIRSYTAELKALEKKIETAENNRDMEGVKRLMGQSDQILSEMQQLRRGRAPAAAATNPAGSGVIVRDKKSGKVFRYKGSAADVPKDRFEIVQ